MSDTDPLDLDGIEARLNAGTMPEPGERVQTTRALLAEVRRLREAAKTQSSALTYSPHVLGATPAGHAEAHGQSEAAYHSASIDDTGYSHSYPGRLSVVQCQWCTRAFAAHTKDEAMALFREHEKAMLA